MDTNSEIYNSMASSLLTLITICCLSALKSQIEFLIQMRFCGVVTERVTRSFHIVTHTLPTSSLTVNSLMTAGSPFFIVADLTVCYIVGMVVMNTNSEIYTSMASSLLTFITICHLNVLKSQMECLIQMRFCSVVTERVAMSFHIVTHAYATNVIFHSQFFNDCWFCILCSNWFDCLLHSWHGCDECEFRNV